MNENPILRILNDIRERSLAFEQAYVSDPQDLTLITLASDVEVSAGMLNVALQRQDGAEPEPIE